MHAFNFPNVNHRLLLLDTYLEKIMKRNWLASKIISSFRGVHNNENLSEKGTIKGSKGGRGVNHINL